MTTRVFNLRCDGIAGNLAADPVNPQLSWSVEAQGPELAYLSRRVRLYSGEGDSALVWESLVTGRAAMEPRARYDGDVLHPGSRYRWGVEVVLSNGEVLQGESELRTSIAPASWDAAAWIGMQRPEAIQIDNHPAPYLRRQFVVPLDDVESAQVHVTAGGLAQLWLNDSRVGESEFIPGWTDYRYRVPFHVFDVTDCLIEGRNTFGAILGEGWYSGFVGPFGKRAYWGQSPVLRAIVVIRFRNGDVLEIPTDSDWECAHGKVELAELLHGSAIDVRKELEGWATGSDDGTWGPVDVLPGPAGKLVPAKIRPIREIAAIPPRAVFSEGGSTIVDFGQNFAGRVRLRARGAAGAILRLRHAELLNRDGTLYVENLRSARATDTFVLSGSEDLLEPLFTIHGFRYAEITGYPGELDASDIVGVVYSSIDETSLDFVTSSAVVNGIQHNLQWSLLSNFHEVPTDCPNRDERLGWAGDAHIFASTAMWNADVQTFFDKWLDDVGDAQKVNGAFSDIAPNSIVDFAEEGAPGYADAGVFVPWDLYTFYGDARYLERFLPRAERWIELAISRNPDLIWRNDRNADYGDWIAEFSTDKALVATAYLARACSTTAKYAEVLGMEDTARRFWRLFERVRTAFQNEFVGSDHRIVARGQAARALALEFGLLSPEQAAEASRELVEDVERLGRLTVGFLAIRHVLPALTHAGRSDLALRAITTEDHPSLGSQLAAGLTTIGEHWAPIHPDGRITDPSMNSFNHFALGAVGEWFYQHVAGLRPTEPGFTKAIVEPRADLLSSASLAVATACGTWSVSWQGRGTEVRLDVRVPVGAEALVVLPAPDRHLGQYEQDLSAIDPMTRDGERWIYRVGSGRHQFHAEGTQGNPPLDEEIRP